MSRIPQRGTVQRVRALNIEHAAFDGATWSWSRDRFQAHVFPFYHLEDCADPEQCAEAFAKRAQEDEQTGEKWRVFACVFTAGCQLEREKLGAPSLPPAPEPIDRNTIKGRIDAAKHQRRARLTSAHLSPEEAFERLERQHLA